jgi:ketosteroid isomerase-like protein
MNRRLTLAALFALAGCFPGLAHPPVTLTPQGQQGVAEEIEVFRQKLAAAIAAKDVAFLRKAYADGFSHTHTSSRVDGKDARIVSALAGDFVIENSSANDVRIRAHAGGWVAVATGITPTPVQPDGKVFAVHWTVTYVREGEQWQIAASHATRGQEIRK